MYIFFDIDWTFQLLISEDPLGPAAASLLSYNLKTPALIMHIFL